jgi:hypothetical protein
MKNTIISIKEGMQKCTILAQAAFRINAKKAGFAAVGSLLSVGAIAAPDASTVNTQASGINKFIEDLLNGDIGYMLTLVAFFAGLAVAIFKKEWMPVFYGFFIAVAILIVPGAMRGLFTALS